MEVKEQLEQIREDILKAGNQAFQESKLQTVRDLVSALEIINAVIANIN